MGGFGCGERGLKRESIFGEEQVGGNGGEAAKLHLECLKFEMPVPPLSREVTKKPVAVGA